MNDPTAKVASVPTIMPATMLTPVQEELQRMQLAKEICRARSLPPSFQNSPADVFLLRELCDKFNLTFSLAVWDCYSIKGKIFFGGKIAGAMLINSGKLATRPVFTYTGQGDELTIHCSARLVGETEPRVSSAVLKSARTENNANWKKDPHQQLIYFVTRKWGNAHAPEVMLGALFEGDEVIDVSPTVVTVDEHGRVIDGAHRLAAHDVQMQPPAEPQPGDPYAMQMPDEVADQKTGELMRPWRPWGAQLIAYIRAASTIDAIDRWLELNNDAIVLMRDEMPALHRQLENSIKLAKEALTKKTAEQPQ